MRKNTKVSLKIEKENDSKALTIAHRRLQKNLVYKTLTFSGKKMK